MPELDPAEHPPDAMMDDAVEKIKITEKLAAELAAVQAAMGRLSVSELTRQLRRVIADSDSSTNERVISVLQKMAQQAVLAKGRGLRGLETVNKTVARSRQKRKNKQED